MTQSNSQGRALEYIILQTILEDIGANKIQLTERTNTSQERDIGKFESLPEDTQILYKNYAENILNWLKDKFALDKSKSIKIDRLSDTDAMQGDVTDIGIDLDKQRVNLSIKHNHFALKHQRPPTLALRCGFVKGQNEDAKYRKSLEQIYDAFHSKRTELASDVSTFKELKIIQSDFINKNLYLPVCNLTTEFINTHSGKKDLASCLFTFLIGNKNFYKITAGNGNVHIQEYADIQEPDSVHAVVKDDSYVILSFSNGWVLSLRLHTAKTDITKTPSLKFDTQSIENPIPEEVL